MKIKKLLRILLCGAASVSFELAGQVPGTPGRIYSPHKGNITYYDASGRVSGTARNNGNRTEYRDRSGKFIGSATKNGNTVTFRDRSGRITGNATRNGNIVTYRDRSGQITRRTHHTAANITIRDRSGRSGGTVSGSGTTRYRRSASGTIVERFR